MAYRTFMFIDTTEKMPFRKSPHKRLPVFSPIFSLYGADTRMRMDQGFKPLDDDR